MISPYHLQFLDHLTQRGVAFIIIGGQARYQHFGTSTRDLDIWVRVTEDNSNLSEAVASWVTRYPSHVVNPWDWNPPFDFNRKIQIHFPETDASFQSGPFERAEIAPATA